MKHFRFLAMLLLTVTFAFTACDGGGGGGTSGDIDVVFQSAVQAGGTSATVESTGITLTFDTDPDTLTADNITVTGARKVSLSGTGTTRTLTIADINVANEGTVTVAITSPSGYTITGSTQTAAVYRNRCEYDNWDGLQRRKTGLYIAVR